MNKKTKNSQSIKLMSILADVVSFILLAVAVFIIFFLIREEQDNQAKLTDLDNAVEYANSLLNNELYNEAITEFNEILKVYHPDPKKAANIIYTTGNIYYADLRDYRGALKQYLKLRTLFPDNPLNSEANKKIVSCLDFLGRSAQAQQALEQSVMLGDKSSLPKGGKTVAKIGDRNITMREINAAMNRLPEQMLEEFKGELGKYKFIQQYVGQELMYDMALRRGYDKDQQVIDDLHTVKRQILIQKIYQDEIGGKIDIKEEDIRFYYEQHQDEFKDMSMEEAVQQIQRKLQMQKMGILEQELIKRMIDAEQVQVFPDSLGIDPNMLEEYMQ